MTKMLKLIAIGNSTGAVLPRDLLNELRVQKGDSLYVLRTPDGVELRAVDPEFETQMAVARDVMRNRRAALRELAK